MEATQLAKIKRRLGIDPTDNLENDLLTDLVEDAESGRLLLVVVPGVCNWDG